MKVQIKADGGSRGNPGIAGSGTVLYDASGTVLTSIADYVGTATNNVAEYRALLNGLEAARDLGATEVEVLMDSKLVVEQMSGRWKIKHPDMKELAVALEGFANIFALRTPGANIIILNPTARPNFESRSYRLYGITEATKQ